MNSEIEHIENKFSKRKSDLESSVEYAKRLVDAIFKIGERVQYERLDYFLIYKPKDIISGDFIWHKSKYDRHYFAVADCTGHGVPGAFMSIVSYNLFSEAVNEHGFNQPSQILDFINKRHFEIFNKDSNVGIKDGMDVAICVIDTDAEIIEYAGAMRPLIIQRNDGSIERIRGDRMSIGEDGYKSLGKFTDHIIDFVPGDIVYMTTDGYVDQFGGPRGKKFKSSRFMDLINTTSELTMEEKKLELESTLEQWRGDKEQIDDITVLAIQFR